MGLGERCAPSVLAGTGRLGGGGGEEIVGRGAGVDWTEEQVPMEWIVGKECFLG